MFMHSCNQSTHESKLRWVKPTIFIRISFLRLQPTSRRLLCQEVPPFLHHPHRLSRLTQPHTHPNVEIRQRHRNGHRRRVPWPRFCSTIAPKTVTKCSCTYAPTPSPEYIPYILDFMFFFWKHKFMINKMEIWTKTPKTCWFCQTPFHSERWEGVFLIQRSLVDSMSTVLSSFFNFSQSFFVFIFFLLFSSFKTNNMNGMKFWNWTWKFEKFSGFFFVFFFSLALGVMESWLSCSMMSWTWSIPGISCWTTWPGALIRSLCGKAAPSRKWHWPCGCGGKCFFVCLSSLFQCSLRRSSPRSLHDESRLFATTRARFPRGLLLVWSVVFRYLRPFVFFFFFSSFPCIYFSFYLQFSIFMSGFFCYSSRQTHTRPFRVISLEFEVSL